MNKEELLKKVDELLESEEVRENRELTQLFSKGRNSLEKAGFDSLGDLSQALSFYLMSHYYAAPANVIEFASWIAKSLHEKRGKASFLQMLAMTLIGLK